MAGPPPPPPPPPPPGNLSSRPPPATGKGRDALLGDIQNGRRLKSVQTNDRSAPIVGKTSGGSSGPPVGGAPPVPGLPRAPSGLAPPVPEGGNRARSNSDTGGDTSGDGVGGAPQLGGLFAGGIPKLRKAGGVNTGADSHSPYLSDPETSRASAPRPPIGAAPKPPGAPPRPPGGAPRPPRNPAISALKNNLRPTSMLSTHSTPEFPPKAKPKPPALGKKPPIPPPTSRKPSGTPPVPPSSTPSAPPPPPPSSVPRPPAPPPTRSTPPPPPAPPSAPPPPTNGAPSLAAQAARNAFGRSSPAARPPPPPAASPPPPAPAPPLPPSAAPAPPPPPPPPASAPPQPAPPSSPPSRPSAQIHLRNVLDPRQTHSMLDASAYTLTNGGSSWRSSSATSPGLLQARGSVGGGGGGAASIPRIVDNRWKFQDDGQLPKPREFTGGVKRYRAGRGSSVPLDLSAYE